MRSVARPQANQTGENIQVYRYMKEWVFIIPETYIRQWRQITVERFTLESPKMEQNRPKSPKIASCRARRNLCRNTLGAYLTRNII